MKCHSTAVNANGFVLQFSFVQKCFKTKQPEVQKIEAPLQRLSLKSGVNFKPRFEIFFWSGTFLSPCSCSPRQVSSWASWCGPSAPAWPSQCSSTSKSTTFTSSCSSFSPQHCWFSGQHFSITWQDWSEFAWVPDLGIPKWPSSNPSPWPSPTFSTSSPPSSPLLLQLLLLGLLSCSSATHTGAAASRKQTRSTRLLTQSLHPPFRSRTLS